MKTIFYLLIILLTASLVSGAPAMETFSNINVEVEGDTQQSNSNPTNNQNSGSRGIHCNTELWIESNYCISYCERYIERYDCESDYYSKHLCCKYYYNQIKIDEEEINQTEIESNQTEEVQETEQIEWHGTEWVGKKIKPNIYLISITMSLILIATIIFLYLMYNEKKEVDNNDKPNKKSNK